MLSWSSDVAGTPAELGVVVSTEVDRAGDLPHERELLAFADAAAGRDEGALDAARRELAHSAGVAVMVDAAAVIAAFEMFTRAVDGTGGRFDPATASARADLDARLGVGHFTSAR